MEITVADDMTLSFFGVVEAAAKTEEIQVQRLNMLNADYIVYATLVSITKTPVTQRNQLMTRTISLALQGENSRY
ncbi:Phage tail protein [compost metagenome]